MQSTIFSPSPYNSAVMIGVKCTEIIHVCPRFDFYNQRSVFCSEIFWVVLLVTPVICLAERGTVNS